MKITQFIKDTVEYMSNGNVDGGYFRECEFIAYELGCKFQGYIVNNDCRIEFKFVSKVHKKK